jgi:formate dehydrogenase subunit gamma
MRIDTSALSLSALLRAVAAIVVIMVAAGLAAPSAQAQSSLRLDTPTEAADPAVSGQVPGNTLGTSSQSDIWRAVKEGGTGAVASQDPNAARLVQYEGQTWREIHNGPLPRYGAWLLLGVIVFLAFAFALLGRVRIDEGRAGRTITRFNAYERAGHWMTASAFVVLSLTGLNMLYGKSVLLPLIGHEAFAMIAAWGKYIHNYVAFAFMFGLAIIFLQWVVYNFPSRHDLVWLAKGGGILVRNIGAPAKKFNAGQKIIFWLTIFCGVSLSLSGWALLYPFTTHFMADTFVFLAKYGMDVPSWLGLPQPPYTAIMEQQMDQIWHAAMGLGLTAIIIAHIYIGTLGMEGAFEAMGTGEVDVNWAKEHHNLWAAKVLEKEAQQESSSDAGAAQQPAE